jgi:NAD(P)-dependent dehydrogenase (short-subunit alcohol dehydrogenase family)
MGFATAKLLGRDHHIVICDVNQQRLDTAQAELTQLGIDCDAIECDITQRASVDALVEFARSLGEVVAVVHTAGISPQMAGPEAILTVNALGTVNIVNGFYALAKDNFALVNVASMAAHMLPALMIPTRRFPLAESSPKAFIKKIAARCRLMPKDLYRKGMAYSISKNFVIWYCKVKAAEYGAKGARILSVSPGTFDTEMGRLEEKSGSMKMLDDAALKRAGTPEEMAELLAFCASEKASYLTGTDILCDGGVVAAKMRR